jgi:adenosylcobinamide-phosphate synthase
MISVVSLVLALLLDKLLGEPSRYHPLVGFGALAEAVEKFLYADSKLRGLLAMALLLVPLTLSLILLQRWLDHWLVDVIVLYLALGWQSLISHAQRVQEALLQSNIALARKNLGFMVSRETRALDETSIAKGVVESVLENGNDAIFGAIFWFMVAGAPGVLVYRLANTLDAMWGYRNERYLHFGWAAARLDDILNLVPARLTALSYALAGQYEVAMHCWKEQGWNWKSPNAGPVMAAGAGSLGLLLGGSENYHGQLQSRIKLGEGCEPDAQSIANAESLIQRSLLIWVLVLAVGAGLLYAFNGLST